MLTTDTREVWGWRNECVDGPDSAVGNRDLEGGEFLIPTEERRDPIEVPRGIGDTAGI